MQFRLPLRFFPRPLSLLLLGLLSACANPSPPSAAEQLPPQIQTQIQPSCPPLPTVVQPVCPPCPQCPPKPQKISQATEQPRPRQVNWADIDGWHDDQLEAAWPALLRSCERLGKQAPWQASCAGASTLGKQPGLEQVREFFVAHFTPWQLPGDGGDGSGLVTGYYEPLIEGSRHLSSTARWPIHGVPTDLISVELSATHPELKGLRLRGRLEGNRLLPYLTRAEIRQAGAQLPAPILLWAADPIELFFLQIQGSGRVRLADGSHARIGYAEHNGHPYHSIGRWLIERNELTLEQASMEGIKQWARTRPERLQELLNVNPAYVFFRELPAGDDGPIGALGVPLSAGRSLAVDPQYVPLGAPVFLSTTYPLSKQPLRRLMLAQDTGAAIKGSARADFFWGFGAEAGREAGRMRQSGKMWLLLPQGMLPPGMLPADQP